MSAVPRELRRLLVTGDGPPFLAAASGLVIGPRLFYVISDDDLALGVFARAGTAPGRRAPVLPGRLPDEPAARKAAKPDFEALVELPRALLALGSGSTVQRRRGALVPLGPDGEPGLARAIDLAPLFARLDEELDELNIEGAVLAGDALTLLQRGNGRGHENALIELAAAPVLDALAAGRPPPASALRAIRRVDLGDVDGVPLTFTDGASLGDGRLLVAAAAEETDDPYRDGRCLGSVVGILDSRFAPLARAAEKIEGVALAGDDIWLVADADDPSTPAPLLVVPGGAPR